ncbi:MAG: hypothetical protein ABWY39_12125 [Mycobacterium sp.]
MSDTVIPKPAETRPVGAKAGLGLVALTAIVVGSMIGSGIFALPSQLPPVEYEKIAAVQPEAA